MVAIVGFALVFLLSAAGLAGYFLGGSQDGKDNVR